MYSTQMMSIHSKAMLSSLAATLMLAALCLGLLGCGSKAEVSKNNQIVAQIEALADANLEARDYTEGTYPAKLRDARQKANQLLNDYSGSDKPDLSGDMDELFRLREIAAKGSAEGALDSSSLNAYEAKKIEITSKYCR